MANRYLLKLVPVDKLLNPKWGNAGCKLEDLCEEMQSNISRVKTEFQTIEDLHLSCELQVKDRYLERLSMTGHSGENPV